MERNSSAGLGHGDFDEDEEGHQNVDDGGVIGEVAAFDDMDSDDEQQISVCFFCLHQFNILTSYVVLLFYVLKNW
jgi:hypothetical protein